MSPSSHQCQGWSSCAVSECKPLACTDIAASWTSGQTHTVLGKDREHTGAKKDLGINFWAIFVPYIVNSEQFLFLRLLEIFAFSLPACLAGQQLWVRLFLIHHSPLHLSGDPECIIMAGWNFPATAWSGTPSLLQLFRGSRHNLSPFCNVNAHFVLWPLSLLSVVGDIRLNQAPLSPMNMYLEQYFFLVLVQNNQQQEWSTFYSFPD